MAPEAKNRDRSAQTRRNADGSWRSRIPNAVTLLRPLFGALCGVAVYQGHGETASWLFLLGYLTDVLDGLLARTLRVASAAGRRLDGRADLAFSTMFGAGLAGWAIRESEPLVIAVLGFLILGAVGGGLLLSSYSVLSKATAAVHRIVWFGLLLVTVEPNERSALLVVGLAVGALTFAYEGVVTWNELKSGARKIR